VCGVDSIRKLSSPVPARIAGQIAVIRGLGRFLRASDGLEEACKSGPSL
jgi:hypothetical protein